MNATHDNDHTPPYVSSQHIQELDTALASVNRLPTELLAQLPVRRLTMTARHILHAAQTSLALHTEEDHDERSNSLLHAEEDETPVHCCLIS